MSAGEGSGAPSEVPDPARPAVGPAVSTASRLGIGQVIDRLRPEFPEVTISKIRFLEAEGLVTPTRAPSGYRKFSAADVERLRYVLASQRDHFLPLRVIRENLEAIDRGLEPPRSPADATPRAPRAAPGEELPSAEDFRPRAQVRLSRAELLSDSGLDRELLAQLESYSIVAPVGGGDEPRYGLDALEIARTCARLRAYGFEARHLRQFKVAADREVGLMAQAVAPLGHGRDAHARDRADAAIRELAALSVRLHAALLRTGLADSRHG